jgi:phosphatidylserine/phosphatidylglycerophosphate/cardiolipin synthase-like enzyme
MAILALIAWIPTWSTNLIIKNAPTEVYFSPNGGCQDAVVSTIRHAKKSILVQAYSFTSAPIAEALKQAHSAGINVAVILDRSQETGHYSGITYLKHAGIPVWLDRHHAIAHNKVMIIDNETVITGSFNFTKAAEKSNAENIIIINNSQLAQLYINNWQLHKQHSELASYTPLRLTK